MNFSKADIINSVAVSDECGDAAFIVALSLILARQASLASLLQSHFHTELKNLESDLDALRAIHAGTMGRAEPLSMEELEVFARALLQYRDRPRSGHGVESFPPTANPGIDLGQLNILRLGAAPPGLHEKVEREWALSQDAWASRATLEALEGQMRRLLAPLAEVAIETEHEEKEFSLEEERLNTLRALAELLDELVEDAPRDDLGGAPTAATTPEGSSKTPGAEEERI